MSYGQTTDIADDLYTDKEMLPLLKSWRDQAQMRITVLEEQEHALAMQQQALQLRQQKVCKDLGKARKKGQFHSKAVADFEQLLKELEEPEDSLAHHGSGSADAGTALDITRLLQYIEVCSACCLQLRY